MLVSAHSCPTTMSDPLAGGACRPRASTTSRTIPSISLILSFFPADTGSPRMCVARRMRVNEYTSITRIRLQQTSSWRKKPVQAETVTSRAGSGTRVLPKRCSIERSRTAVAESVEPTREIFPLRAACLFHFFEPACLGDCPEKVIQKPGIPWASVWPRK